MEHSDCTLTVIPQMGQRVLNIIEVEDNMVDNIMSWIKSDDEHFDLYDYVYGHQMETFCFSNLINDEKCDYLNYYIEDANGDSVDDGTIKLNDKNVEYIRQEEVMDYTQKHPTYLLFSFDIIMRPSCTYSGIAENFEPDKIGFKCYNIFSKEVFPLSEIHELEGKTFSLTCPSYNGEEIEGIDSDEGIIGDNTYYLFKYNDTEKKYEIIAKTEYS